MSSSSPTINRFDGGLNDDSISQFDASINTGQPSSSEDIVPYTPSAQLTYQGRPMSQPKTPVFKLAETNLLDYVNNTSEKDLLTVVGVHKQDSESSMQPPSPGGLTWISLNKFATKQIVQAADDDWKTRPDVKRKEREGPARDHEIMKTTSLTDMRCNIPPKYVPEDPFEDPTGNLKSNALFPKRIDTFPTEESKLARAAHMKELRRLRKYKHGVPPDQRLLLLDRELAALMPLLDTNATTTATTTGTTIGKMRSFDTKDTELTLNINLDISPPSPMGIIPGFENDEASIHSRHSQDLVNKLVSPVLSTKRKPLVVKNIPEEKLGYYKRISNISITSSVPTSAVISDPSTAGTSENNSLASSRAGNSANVRPVLADTLRQTAIEEELMGRTRPLTNNPLQRYRIEEQTANRLSSREPIRCCRCSKDSSFWCPQCCLSYCHTCWSTVAHHGFVSNVGLPSPPKSAQHQDIPFSAFPALKKATQTAMETTENLEHLPVYAPTRSNLSRVGASIKMLRHDKPFYKGLQLSEDALQDIDLTLFGGLEGMKGNKQPRPRSGRPGGPGEWRKPVQNLNNDRGILVPNKKKKGKKKKMVINIPNLSVVQSISGRSTLSLGTLGAPPLYAYPMTGISHDYFPDEWKDTRPKIEITVCKGVPVYTVPKEHFLNKTA